MDSIRVFEAFTELSREAREEKRIITHQEFENFIKEYKVHKTKKDFIEEWWDYRFMKALKLIDNNTSEEEFQETLKEYREEKDRKRLERKQNTAEVASEIQDSGVHKTNPEAGNRDSESKSHPNPSVKEEEANERKNRETLKNRVNSLIEKLAGLL